MMKDFVLLKQGDVRPWLSLVVPAKHEDAYLPQTLERFHEARLRHDLNFEVVVVLAAASRELISRCSRADTIVLELDRGTGTIARARNAGAFYSKGEILFHTDADVEVQQLDALLTRVRALMADSRVVAITCAIMPRPCEARPLDRAMHLFGNSIIRSAHACGVYLARGECQIVKRAEFEEVNGYREDITVGEDWDLFQRLSNSGGLVVFDHESVVLHSTRRFLRTGYLRTMLLYFREGLSLRLLNRSWLTEWQSIR